ncbi:MAG: hypothetical protein M2R45_01868 [Verrucomicrobia subdivision 3 bacterium]|nr:hypothetical protein [Limisphaerales bacterium]MCS1415668.1 hypothetical protein [Limisphaerales bacterium]
MKSKAVEDNRFTHQEIAHYAYLLWEEAGCPHGRDVEFWVKAENILHAGIAASGVAQVSAVALAARATAVPRKKTSAPRKKTAKPFKTTKTEKAKPKKKATRGRKSV